LNLNEQGVYVRYKAVAESRSTSHLPPLLSPWGVEKESDNIIEPFHCFLIEHTACCPLMRDFKGIVNPVKNALGYENISRVHIAVC
jgi:hypothetical protein